MRDPRGQHLGAEPAHCDEAAAQQCENPGPREPQLRTKTRGDTSMQAISIAAVTTNPPVPHPPSPPRHGITVSFIDLDVRIITHSCAHKCVLCLCRTTSLVKCVCLSCDHDGPCLAPRSCCPGAVFPHKTLEHLSCHVARVPVLAMASRGTPPPSTKPRPRPGARDQWKP